MTAPLQPDKPVAGHYQTKLVKGGPWVAVLIWHGPPLDPETGEELDRSHRFQALRDGKPVDIWTVWPFVASHPIDEPRYRFLLKKADWAVEHDPRQPEANPTKRIDFNKVPPVF